MYNFAGTGCPGLVDDGIKLELVLRREQRLRSLHQEELNKTKILHVEEKKKLLLEVEQREESFKKVNLPTNFFQLCKLITFNFQEKEHLLNEIKSRDEEIKRMQHFKKVNFCLNFCHDLDCVILFQPAEQRANRSAPHPRGRSSNRRGRGGQNRKYIPYNVRNCYEINSLKFSLLFIAEINWKYLVFWNFFQDSCVTSSVELYSLLLMNKFL